MSWLIWTTIGLGLLYAIANLLTYTLQDRFIFWPNRLPDNHTFNFGSNCEEITIGLPGGGYLNALYFTAEGEAKGNVLYCHGNAGNLERWGLVERQFTSRGWNCLVYDYRGYGKSRGKKSEKGMYAGALMMYDYLAARDPGSRILVYGRSMGTALACYTSRHRPGWRLILETPFSSIPDLFYSYYPFLPRIFFFRFRFPNRDHLKNVTEPVTIFQGTRDRVTPLRNARRLQASLKPGDEFVLLPGARHHNCADFTEFQDKLDEILGKSIAHKKS